MKAVRLETVFVVLLGVSALGGHGPACGAGRDNCLVIDHDVPMTPEIAAAAAAASADAGSSGDAAPSADGGPLEDAGPPPPYLPTREQCLKACNDERVTCAIIDKGDGDGGTVQAIHCYFKGSCGGGGRRPEGLAKATVHSRDPRTIWLLEAAHLEAASVEAFRRLRTELHQRGAPRSLLRRASRAAADERRHARAMRSLARRRHVEQANVEVEIAPVKPRSLEAMAIENAVEGCVRETFAALIARRQAMHAQDREVRAAMTRIAAEETRHAALSWSIDAWAMARLDPAARARVDEARVRAATQLMEESALADAQLGLPDAATARSLARGLFAALGSGGALSA